MVGRTLGVDGLMVSQHKGVQGSVLVWPLQQPSAALGR